MERLPAFPSSGSAIPKGMKTGNLEFSPVNFPNLSQVDVNRREALDSLTHDIRSWIEALPPHHERMLEMATKAMSVSQFVNSNFEAMSADHIAEFRGISCSMLITAFNKIGRPLLNDEYDNLTRFCTSAAKSFINIAKFTNAREFLASGRKYWDDSVKLYPVRPNTSTLFNLLSIYLELAWRENQEADAMRIVSQMKEILNHDSMQSYRATFVRTLYNHGVNFFKQKNFSLAIQWVQTSMDCPLQKIEVDKDAASRDSRSFRVIALCYYELKSFDQALFFIRKAKLRDSLNPDNSFILIELLVKTSHNVAEIEKELESFLCSNALDMFCELSELLLQNKIDCHLFFSQLRLRFPNDKRVADIFLRHLLLSHPDEVLKTDIAETQSLPLEYTSESLSMIFNHATKLYAAENFAKAISFFSCYLSFLKKCSSVTGPQTAQVHSALALCHFKMLSYERCLIEAELAIGFEVSSDALVLKILCELSLHRENEARQTLDMMLSTDIEIDCLGFVCKTAVEVKCTSVLVHCISSILEQHQRIGPFKELVLLRALLCSLHAHLESEMSSSSESVLSPHFERFHHYLNRAFVLLKTGSSLRSDGSLLYEEFKFFSEMTWNLALCAGERMLHFDAKDFFFRFKEFQSLAHLYHSSFQEKDKIDVLYKIKLSLILCACALLETASTYSLSDQKAVSASHEALLYVNECRGLCHVNDFNSPDLKYLSMLFVIEFKCKLFLQDFHLDKLISNHFAPLSGVSPLILETWLYGLYKVKIFLRKSLTVCDAALMNALQVSLDAQSNSFSKIPSLVRQLLLLHADNFQKQESVILMLQKALLGFGEQMKHAYSTVEIDLLVSISWNNGVALYRNKEFFESLKWMDFALFFHQELITGTDLMSCESDMGENRNAALREQMVVSRKFVSSKLPAANPAEL